MAREKMAYVVRISEKIPIEGKDRICVLKNSLNSYQVIGSNEIQVGDFCAYFEVDSILPTIKEFEFLKDRCYKEKLSGYLIKNMKMFGIYSNGLLIPLETLHLTNLKEGDDLTEKLNIRKYEFDDFNSNDNNTNQKKSFIRKYLYKFFPWMSKRHSISEDFPTHLIPKSDQENIQNCKWRYANNLNSQCFVSIKLEGCSVTILIDPKTKKFKMYGRNKVLQEKYVKWFIAKGYDKVLMSIYKKTKTAFALQGELTHPSVQKGIYNNGINFSVYKMKNLTTGKDLTIPEMQEFCAENSFDTVRYINSGKLQDCFSSIDTMLDFVEHLYFTPAVPFTDEKFVINEKGKVKLPRHEGIVVTAEDLTWSFKTKSNEYKLNSDL